MAEIVLDEIDKVYPDGTRAVSSVSIDIQDGEFMVLVGPSGCGKTTALRMIAGLEDVTSGTIRIGDEVVNELAPRDRDIAMVFQSYALYPHMSVYENMAFSLRLRKVDKADVDRRVREAAAILGLEDLLDKKPRHLSGGQRQRVAMGRAIVREPHAFLMDEPLSNLDAKLRVQTRAEVSRIQHELGVTTVYVTHDQTEAMTMGDRVAVMNKGVLQQVADPQYLYDHPQNLFVGGFIGSPAMNLVEAMLERSDGETSVVFGSHRLAVDPEVVAARPSLARFVDRPVLLGIRPEDFEDASLAAGAPDDRRISVTADLREALGSEVLVHFTVDAPIVVHDATKDLAADVEDGSIESLERQAQSGTSKFVARLGPHSKAEPRKSVELSVDTSALHFFDPDTGLAIWNGTNTVPSTTERS